MPHRNQKQDVFAGLQRSELMARIRSRRNKTTEELLASCFREFGISGWRRNSKLIGKPDFVFSRERIAVFVDGCFWHGCNLHSRPPTTNVDFWVPKILTNQLRDYFVTLELRKAGWRVIRVWEHELKKANLNKAISRIKRAFENCRK